MVVVQPGSRLYPVQEKISLESTVDFLNLFSEKNFYQEYKVECKIGEGSFSEVLKCQERSTGKLVAAKQLKKHFKSTSQAVDIPELVALQKISSHRNILDLLESHFDSHSGTVSLVFELMDMSLYEMMKSRKRPVTEARAKKFLYQIIKGIDHLHYHGVFHRDIKPENILIKGERLKISDLGSIKGVYAKHPYTEYISTRWYRSPECLLTKGFYGPKMDVWAIGCVFYELLTLKPLFPGSSEIDQISKINAVLGSPSVKLMSRFKKQRSRNMNVSFPVQRGMGLDCLLPVITEGGRDIIKQMVTYDPELRINIRRSLEHKYFSDMREEELFDERFLATSQSTPGPMKKKSNFNPMWLSYLTNPKRKKTKRKSFLGERSCRDISGMSSQMLPVECQMQGDRQVEKHVLKSKQTFHEPYPSRQQPSMPTYPHTLNSISSGQVSSNMSVQARKGESLPGAHTNSSLASMQSMDWSPRMQEDRRIRQSSTNLPRPSLPKITSFVGPREIYNMREKNSLASLQLHQANRSQMNISKAGENKFSISSNKAQSKISLPVEPFRPAGASKIYYLS